MKQIAKIFQSQTIRDSFIVFLGLGVTAVLGFIYTIIMARTLTPELFGVFSGLVSLVAITYSLGDLGLGPAIINFLPKHKNFKSRIIETGYWFEYLVGFIIFLAFWLLANFSHTLIPGSLPEHFILVGSLAFNYILVTYAQAVFTAKREFFRLSLSQIIDAVLKIIFVLLFYNLGELSFSTALLANFISVIFSLVLTFWSELWNIKTQVDKTIFSHLFEFSKWIAVSRFFSVLISRVDILLLNLLASNFQAGIYAAASRVALIFALIISSLGSVINPRFSHFQSKKEVITYMKKLSLLITFVSLFVLITIYFSDKIILFVFGLSYLSASNVYQLLALSMIPFLFSVITTGTLLYTFNQSKFYAQITALQVALIILINLLYIPKIGVYAPVLASAVANLLFLLLSLSKLQKLFKTHDLAKKVVFKDTP